VVTSVQRTPAYIEFVKQFELRSENKNLLQLALDSNRAGIGRDAAGLLLSLNGDPLVWNILNGKDSVQTKAMLNALRRVGSNQSVNIIQTIVLSPKYPMNIRKDAASKIGNSWSGEDRVLEILKAKKLPAELIPYMVSSVSGAWRSSVRSEAESYLPGHIATTLKKAPTISELALIKGDGVKGKVVFTNACALCHMVEAEGKDFGPKLTEIGSKYGKDGLLNAIVHPSDGISFGYEGWIIKMNDGSTMTGMVASKTATDIDIKLPGGTTQRIKTANIASMEEMKQSMMPEGLYQNMSNEDLANLLEYLEGLKKEQ